MNDLKLTINKRNKDGSKESFEVTKDYLDAHPEIIINLSDKLTEGFTSEGTEYYVKLT